MIIFLQIDTIRSYIFPYTYKETLKFKTQQEKQQKQNKTEDIQ